MNVLYGHNVSLSENNSQKARLKLVNLTDTRLGKLENYFNIDNLEVAIRNYLRNHNSFDYTDGDVFDLELFGEIEYFGVEVQFSIQNALNIFGIAKTMLLTFEWQVSDRQPLLPNGFKHFLSLIRRYHFILQSLE